MNYTLLKFWDTYNSRDIAPTVVVQITRESNESVKTIWHTATKGKATVQNTDDLSFMSNGTWIQILSNFLVWT